MRRAAHILATLEANRQVSADDLALSLGVSRRTVTNEVATLQESLGSAASLVLADGRYRLLIADPHRYAQVRDELEADEPSFNEPETRVSYLIARLFRALVPVRIDEMALAMSVGRTTVVADLARAREVVGEAGLAISGRPNVGLELEGPEWLKRLHVLRAHFEMAYPKADPAIESVCAELAGLHGLHGSIVPELVRWATMVLDRSRTRHTIEYLPNRYAGIVETKAHDFASQLAGRLTALSGVQIPVDDVVFLSLPVIGMRAQEDRDADEWLSEAEAAELAEQVLGAIRDETDIDLLGADLLHQFARHLALMVNRVRYDMWIDAAGLANIDAEFPLAHEMAIVASRLIESRVGLPVDRSEIALLTAYFQVFLEARRAEAPAFLRVLVLVTRGRVAAELVRLQLAKLLPATTELLLIDLASATPEVLADADLVVIDGPEPVDTPTPVLHISKVLDRHNLERQLDRLQLRLSWGSTGGASVLASALDETHFFALPADTDYLDGVEYMCGRLRLAGWSSQVSGPASWPARPWPGCSSTLWSGSRT